MSLAMSLMIEAPSSAAIALCVRSRPMRSKTRRSRRVSGCAGERLFTTTIRLRRTLYVRQSDYDHAVNAPTGEREMAKIEAEMTIARPADEVWAVAADTLRHPRWMTVESAEALKGDGSHEGDRGRERARMGPMKFESEFTVSEAVPGRRITWRVDSGPPYDGRFFLELTPIDASTSRARYGAELRMKGLMRLLAPFMGGEAKSEIANELAKLKAVVESGGR